MQRPWGVFRSQGEGQEEVPVVAEGLGGHRWDFVLLPRVTRAPEVCATQAWRGSYLGHKLLSLEGLEHELLAEARTSGLCLDWSTEHGEDALEQMGACRAHPSAWPRQQLVRWSPDLRQSADRTQASGQGRESTYPSCSLVLAKKEALTSSPQPLVGPQPLVCLLSKPWPHCLLETISGRAWLCLAQPRVALPLWVPWKLSSGQ